MIGSGWNAALQGVKAVIQRQQRMFAEGYASGFLLWCQNRGTRFFRTHPGIVRKVALLPFRHRLGIDGVAPGQHIHLAKSRYKELQGISEEA